MALTETQIVKIGKILSRSVSQLLFECRRNGCGIADVLRNDPNYRGGTW